MIWQVEFWLLLVLVALAVVALEVRDLLAAAVVLSGYSFVMALLFVTMGAVDVAFTEATLGAGVSGLLFLVALFYLERRSNN
ncbi:MAG TPA: hydrogenase subunit MbhD domain-containing protein [Candidatus Binatia bacterium]|nr:hydrogenase subunit MbhD domain-containing protein [Candidatus Binatia bacterium]